MRRVGLAILLGWIMVAPLAADTALAQIVVTPTETGATIKGRVLGLAKGSAHAVLSISKTGPGGTSNLQQSRSLNLSRGSEDDVGRTHLSLQKGAEVTVSLTVTENEKIIATSETYFGF